MTYMPSLLLRVKEIDLSVTTFSDPHSFLLSSPAPPCTNLLRLFLIDINYSLRCLFLLGCIECMRCRLFADDLGLSICQSVRPSVCQSDCHAASLCGGHSVKPLPNHFNHLLMVVAKNNRPIAICHLQPPIKQKYPTGSSYGISSDRDPTYTARVRVSV